MKSFSIIEMIGEIGKFSLLLFYWNLIIQPLFMVVFLVRIFFVEKIYFQKLEGM